MNGRVFLVILMIFCLKMVLAEVNRNKSMTEFIKDMGYPVEVHQVTTSDGYKLTLHRIPNNASSFRPLLLVHGLFTSGGMFIFKLPDVEKGLPYLLSDAGYDIWIFHARGTHLSMKHERLTSRDKQFWDFSWHEIGLYDIPYTVDYVLETTGSDKIHYAGVSQGTSVFLVAMSMKPEYNRKIASSYLMVPPGSLSYVAGMAKVLIDSQMGQLYLETFKETHVWYIPFKSETTQDMLTSFCNDSVRLCKNLAESTLGPFYPGFDITNAMLLLFNNILDNGSTKQLEHYLQNSRQKKFQAFDYGVLGNMEKYKNKTPPEYDLAGIDVPITLMSAVSDNLATEKDVLLQMSKMRNSRHVRINGNHIDYLAVQEMVNQVKDDMLSFMKEY